MDIDGLSWFIHTFIDGVSIYRWFIQLSIYRWFIHLGTPMAMETETYGSIWWTSNAASLSTAENVAALGGEHDNHSGLPNMTPSTNHNQSYQLDRSSKNRTANILFKFTTIQWLAEDFKVTLVYPIFGRNVELLQTLLSKPVDLEQTSNDGHPRRIHIFANLGYPDNLC